MSIEEQPKLSLELGQVIQIDAPTNTSINKHIYFIDYLDDNLIKLIDNEDLSVLELQIRDNKFTDESIATIAILAKSENQGYALQNELIPDKWISIQFGGDIPTIINGQITNLEEDMIEISTYPEGKTIYIDFEYKGLPLYLSIENISPFTPPKKEVEEEVKDPPSLEEEEEEEEDLDLELQLDTGILEEKIKDIFIDIDDIIVGDELEEITQQIDVGEEQRRYGITSQTNDLLDELLSSVPTKDRTSKVLNNIHIIIERFKQLRRQFSNFDEQGHAETLKKKGANYKPLVKKLLTLNQKLIWLLPIVRNKHKLYDVNIHYDENYDDITKLVSSYVMANEMEIIEQYRKNTVPDGENKYNYLFQELNPYFTPFNLPDDNRNIITIQNVNQNLDTVIDNLDEFYATMVLEDWGSSASKPPRPCSSQITSSRFVIDNYNLGLNRLENPDPRNKKSKAVIIPLTSSDRLALKGFLTLPEIFLKYSHLNLPNTSILDKVNLHRFNFNYFQLLNTDTDIEKRIIHEEAKQNKKLDDVKDKNYLNKIRAYTFEETRILADRDDEDVYETFLNNMIPRTRVLFELVKKYIKNGTSYIKIIEYMEPFLIYTDDISFKQYQTITNFIDEEIIKHKQKILKNVAEFRMFLNKYKSYDIPSILPKLLDKKYSERLFPDNLSRNGYGSIEDINTEESIKKIIDRDAGRAYNDALALSLLTFTQPIDIDERIDEELANITREINEEEEETDACKQLVLAKKYNDIDELQLDNNTVAFFDEKYDETPYDIGQAWFEKKGEYKPQEADNVIRELTTFLMENNGVSKERAARDANAMHLKAKTVQDGDYAILDLGDADYKYYIRENNKWKLDKKLTGKHVDEVTFCNMKKSCIKIKEKCADIDISKKVLKKNILADITRRVMHEFKESIVSVKINVQDEYKYRLQNLHNLKKVKTYNNIKHNLQQIKIAETLEIRDIIVSPYEDLRDNMLSQTDIVKKFNDINIFIDKFCGEPSKSPSNTAEDLAWYYCIDTNVKLLPTFFERLANGFHTSRYEDVLEDIKRERGEISDDGDRWIDKYSGYYICDIAFDTGQGYDTAGYKIVSRYIEEVSTVDKLSLIKDKVFNYKTDTAKEIQRILISLDRFLHISSESEYGFVIKITIESLNTNLLEEKQYLQKQKVAQQKIKAGRKQKSYEIYHDEIFMKSLISAYIIAIQSMIPNIISHKTYPTCKKSFSGFPLDGNSDLTFLKYITCILFNIRTNNKRWRAIPKSSKKTRETKINNYVTILHSFITNKILPLKSVKEKLDNKRIWIKHDKTGEIIPSEFNVQNWTSFLPPLEPVTVTRLTQPGHQFEGMLKKTFETGDFQQFPHLWVLYGKITSFSFSILEAVQRAVNKEPLILTANNGIPFMENACCNEGNPNTNLYFSNKENSIQKHNMIIFTLSNLYYKYKNIIKSPFININKNTKIVFPSISKAFSTSTIYLAFIKFCKFNSGIILDEPLSGICIRNECGFAKLDNIEKKIQMMKDAGLNYSINSLNVLLNIINAKNILNYEIETPVITEKVYLERTLAHLKEQQPESYICHPELLTKLTDIVDRFEINLNKAEDDDIINDFERHLKSITNILVDNIVATMNEKNSLPRRLQDFILESKKTRKRTERFILNWSPRGDEIFMSHSDETGFEIFKLLKEMIINICKIYPNIILNKIDFRKRYVPEHWIKGSRKLSGRHKQDIEKFMMKEYANFTGFYGDAGIESVLNLVTQRSVNLLLLLESIPFYAGIGDEKKYGSIFDGDVIKNLGYYLLLCALKIYIEASNEVPDIITGDDEEEEELDVMEGAKDALETRICMLLRVYLTQIRDYKKMLNKNNESINNMVLKAKEKEKEKVKENLKSLTIEEREVENIKKKHSLGKWGVGQTRAIFEYDENQYDKEREKQESDILFDIKKAAAASLDDTATVEDVEWANEVERRIAAEVWNMDVLPEDDDYGDRDGDGGDYV